MITNGHEPATKADLEALKAELLEHIGINRTETQHNFDALREQMRDMQTEMLKAFYGWAQSTDAKLKECESCDNSFRTRLSALESRQAELEKRLLEMRINLPPQPPQ